MISKREFSLLRLLAGVFVVIGLLTLGGYVYLLITARHLDPWGSFSLPVAAQIAPFLGASVGAFFTAAGTLLIFDNLRQSRKNFARSQFEDVLFHLLNHQRHIRLEIKTEVYKLPTPTDSAPTSDKSDASSLTSEDSGTNFFDELASQITIAFEKLPDQNREQLVGTYHRFFTVHNSDLGHYFRHLYHIVRFIKEDEFTWSRKRNRADVRLRYLRIVRAQLSNSELVVLALNGMTNQGAKFKELVENFELLKNLNPEDDMPEDIQKRVPGISILRSEYQHLDRALAEDVAKR